MPAYYSTFQIENTMDGPISFSIWDPDGNVLKVGTLKPGQISIQVAPLNASWSIQFENMDTGEITDLPVPNDQITISSDRFGEETGDEATSQFLGSKAPSELVTYEALLKLETGSHSAGINQLLVTPDGKSLITSGQDKIIRLWDIEAGIQTGTFLGQIGDGEEGKIQAVAMDPDGKYIVALVWVYPDSHDQAGRESDLRVFERATGNLQACYHYPGTLNDLDFSPDGKFLALICNPKNYESDRLGYVCLFESKEIMQGFGMLPPARQTHEDVIHTTYFWNIVMPAYVRFIPETKDTTSDYRIVVASWIYNLYVPEEGEYTGMLYWYACTPEGLKKIQSCNTAEIVREDPPGVHCIRPDSLAVSRDFVITTAENRAIK